MKIFNKIKEKVASLEVDAVSFYDKGNSAAGRRLRAGLQEIKTLCKDGRDDVTNTKKS